MARQFLFTSDDVTISQVRNGVVGTGWTEWIDLFDHTLLRNVDGNPHPQYGLLSGATFDQLISPDAQFTSLQADDATIATATITDLEVTGSISAQMQSEYERVDVKEQRTSQEWGALPTAGPSFSITTNVGGALFVMGGAVTEHGEFRIVVEQNGSRVFQGAPAFRADLMPNETYDVFLEYRKDLDDSGEYAEFSDRWVYAQKI